MSKPEAIRILCSTDDNYAPYAGIMLTSLFANNRNEVFDVYVLTRGLNGDNYEKLKSVGKQFRSEVNILSVDLSAFEDCPIRPGDHITLEAYFRLMATQLLPERIDRILYLDVDIVIDGLHPEVDTGIGRQIELLPEIGGDMGCGDRSCLYIAALNCRCRDLVACNRP